MRRNNVPQNSGHALRRRRMSVAVTLALTATGSALAFQIETGNPDIEMRWDNTVRYNLGTRIHKENTSGIGNNRNNDEGEFKFKKGDVVANRVDVLSEFDFVHQKSHGVRVSAALWYDQAYKDTQAVRNPNLAAIPGGYVGDEFTSFTKRFYKGPSGEFLDAFAFGTFSLGDARLSLKAGQHTVFWGESLLLGGAVHGVSASQAPLDLQKGFATPGAEAKELFRPLTQISGQLQATPELSLAAQYYFDWNPSRFPEGGTFLGPADMAFSGPQQMYVSPGLGTIVNTGVNKPDKRGDYGLNARWSPKWLDGTMGFYYRNYTDKLLSVTVTQGAAVTASNPGGLQYGQFYGDNIDLFGISLGKQVGSVSVGAELSYRRNVPLSAQTLGFAPSGAQVALGGAAAAFFPKAGLAGNTLNGNTYQARGDTWHFLVNALGAIANTPLFDTASYAVELTYSQLGKVTANPDMYFGEGYGVCDSANATVRATGQYKDKWDGCSTKSAWGIAFNFTPTWFQVLPGMDLSLPLSFSKQINGNSPIAFGGSEDNGNYAIGIGADLYSKYRFDLKFVDYFGKVKMGTSNGLPAVISSNGLTTLLRDRSHLMFTFKTTF